MADPPPQRKSVRQQSRTYRASISPGTPPSAPETTTAVVIPSASQIAAAASSSADAQQFTTHDIFGGASDSDLSDLTESEAGFGAAEGEEEGKVDDVADTVPPPRGKELIPISTGGEGIKRHSKTIQSSDEADSEDAEAAARMRKDSSVREPRRKSREKPGDKIVNVSTPDGLDAPDRETESKPRSKKKLKLAIKRSSEREVSDSGDRSAKSEHEREPDKAAGKRKASAAGAARKSTERDARGSSPVIEAPVKRKSDRDERRDTTSQHVRRSKQYRREDDEDEDDAYDDTSDYARQPKDGSRADGETRKAKPRREEGDVDRSGRTGKIPRGGDEEKRVRKQREASVDPESRKRKVAEGERGKEALRERKRPGVDSDEGDVKEAVAPSQDAPLKKKKRPLAATAVDTADHADTKKKHPLAADRPPLKREDSELEVQSSTGGEPSRGAQKRQGQVKPAKRIAQLSGQGARTPGDKSRTPNTGEPGSNRRLAGVQVKKPYDPLAGALSSLAGIGPGIGSGVSFRLYVRVCLADVGDQASTPINRKP